MNRILVRAWCVCACVALATLYVSADGPTQADIEWIHAYDSEGPALTNANAVAVGSDGSIYVAGRTGGTFPGQAAPSSIAAFVRKYTPTGTEVWTREFSSGITGDQVLAISVDAGGVYIGGLNVFMLPGQTSAGNTDAFVRKYDLDGSELWTREFGSPGNDQVLGLHAEAGGVFVVGLVGETPIGQPSVVNGALPGQSSSGGTDAFLRYYDGVGNELWTRQFGTSTNDRAAGVVADATGVYVVGSVRSPSSDAYVRKFDLNGGDVWTREFGGTPAGSDMGMSVAVDGSGVYVAGGVSGNLPGQTGGDAANTFVRKYTASGAEIWTRQVTAAGNDTALSVSVDGSGVYVAGVVAAALPTQTNAGGSDAFVRRYDFDGVELWTQQFGTSGDDRANSVVASTGVVVVAGTVTGALPGMAAVGVPDGFLRSYDVSTGGEFWTRQFGTTTPRYDGVTSIAVHGQVYSAGASGRLSTLQSATSDGFIRAQALDGTDLWSRRIGSNVPFVQLASDGAFGVAADDSGVYVIGTVTGALEGQINSSGTDAYIRKYDASGTELWTRQFGTTSDVDARSVAVDTTGVYVVGSTTFRPLPGQVMNGFTDAYIRKYSFDGTELWTREFGNTGVNRAFGVAAGPSGIFVVGSTYAAVNGGGTSDFDDAFVSAYTPDGTKLWMTEFGTSRQDQALSVAADASGVYVAGFFGSTSLTVRQGFLRKYDTGGAFMWEQPYTNGLAGSVAIGRGALFVTASSNSIGMVNKYDYNGVELWSNTMTRDDVFLTKSAVAADSSGVYVGGLATPPFPDSTLHGAYVARIADITPFGATDFTSADIGDVSAGADGYSGGTFSVTASGADIWGQVDAFRYLYAPARGDFEIVARVTGLDNTDPWSKAGLMIRQSLSAASRHASLFVTPTTVNGIAFQRRIVDGGDSVHTWGPSATPPVWLRLVRRRDTITAFTRPTPADNWSPVGNDTLSALDDPVYVGLAVTSHSPSTPATATFDSVTVTPLAPLSLPAGWEDEDIGTVVPPGRALASAGTFLVRGSGADIWGTTDAFHFTFRRLTGDGTAIVHVANIVGPQAWSKAGLMIRSSTDPSAIQHFLLVSAAQGVAYQRRETAGGTSLHTALVSPSVASWFMLVRSGGTIHLWYSIEQNAPRHWLPIADAAFPPGEALVGLAVTSHADGALATGTFDHVDISAATAPTFSGVDVGNVGLPGSDSLNDGTYTLSASGSDIWNDADAFRFVYRELPSDGTIVARVGSLAGTDPWSKAGVMIRASTDAASAHAFMFLSQENGLAFQRRTRFGSLTTHTGGGVGAAPVWVRLTRSGDLVTAATSLDGVVWTEVDHDIVSFGAGSVLVGLALTGHNDAALAHATLDHVSLLP